MNKAELLLKKILEAHKRTETGLDGETFYYKDFPYNDPCRSILDYFVENGFMKIDGTRGPKEDSARFV